jgi:hypothetical protein
MNVTATDLFFNDWRAYTYLFANGMLGMAVGLYYNEPALWPAAAAMALLFLTLTLGPNDVVADPEIDDPPGQERWESFKQKLDDRAGGWAFYIGAVYVVSAFAAWYRPYWNEPVPFWAALAGVGVVLIGYDIVRRGVMA